VRDKWIEDCHTNELYGASGIKLFNKENYSGIERFKELERHVLAIHPELNDDECIYTKTEKHNLVIKKNTYDLKIELGNILNNCKEIFKGYFGDATSIASLISSIELNISNCENSNQQEKIICEEIDANNFMYVKIVNKSITKQKTIARLYNKTRK
jgi:hypothetical protein